MVFCGKILRTPSYDIFTATIHDIISEIYVENVGKAELHLILNTMTKTKTRTHGLTMRSNMEQSEMLSKKDIDRKLIQEITNKYAIYIKL